MALLVCYSCGRTRIVEKANGHAFNCSNCGAHEIRPTSKRWKIWADEIVDLDGEERHAARGQTYAGLRWIQEQKGYKPGWVGMKFRKAYHEWPNGETGTASAPPKATLLKWLQRDKNEYRKRMRAEEAKREIVVEKKPEADSALMTAEDYEVKW